jgi:PKD domain
MRLSAHNGPGISPSLVLPLLAMAFLPAVLVAQTPPTATFLYTPTSPMVGTEVNFTDTSSATPINWLWDFGDPNSGEANSSTLQNPTHTYQASGIYTVFLTATNGAGNGTATQNLTVTTGGSSACTPSPFQLCLNNGRFQVTAGFQTPNGDTGVGYGTKLTDQSGYFWFFDAGNVELVVKVLDGCAITNSYWVFAAGLTNVNVNVTVFDTVTGVVYTKENPQGVAFVPIQDTGAFPTSCP